MNSMLARVVANFFGCLLGALLSVFILTRDVMIGIAVALVSAVLFALFLREVVWYRRVRLILDNKLHSVRCMLHKEGGDGLPGGRTDRVEIVISVFGILIGRTAYRFNQRGVKLRGVRIGRETMKIRFDNKKKKQQSIALMHGFAGRKEAQAFAEAIAYETGVIPEFIDWEGE